MLLGGGQKTALHRNPRVVRAREDAKALSCEVPARLGLAFRAAWRGCRVDEDFDSYVERVREDHYLHSFAMITVSVWAGTIYGWMAGVGALIGLFVAITLTNTIILAKTGSLRAVRANRWAWVIFATLAIVASSAEVQTIQACRDGCGKCLNRTTPPPHSP